MSNSLITTQTTTNSPARARRTPRPPSDRDLDIYKRIKIKGHAQYEVAVDLELHYSRVSQILKRVTRWLASGGDPLDPVIREHVARQRLNHANLKLRLARAVELASMALEFHAPLHTTRKRYHGMTEAWREETIRDVRFTNPGTLRMLIDAIKTLQQLEQNVNHSDSQTPKPSDHDLLRAVFDFLCGWRSRAESDGLLPTSESVAVFIANNLITILGLPADQFARYLPSPAPLNAQVPVPTAQVPLPNPQVPVPAPQEALKLSTLPDTTIDTTLTHTTPSILPSEKFSSSLERSGGPGVPHDVFYPEPQATESAMLQLDENL